MIRNDEISFLQNYSETDFDISLVILFSVWKFHIASDERQMLTLTKSIEFEIRRKSCRINITDYLKVHARVSHE